MRLVVNMILIYTNTDDFTADYFILFLEYIGKTYFRVNTDQFPHNLRVTWEISDHQIGGCFESATGIARFEDVTSIWYRKPVFHRDVHTNPAINRFIEAEVQASLEGVIRSLPGNFVSRPDAIYHAEHKLVQLKAAMKMGFQIPHTLLTSRQSDGASFLNVEECITKPIKRGRVIQDSQINLLYTTPITSKQFSDHISSLRLTPAYLQTHIKKKLDLRVTIFGNECFCVAIHSQEHTDTVTDWRKNQDVLLQTVWELPAPIQQMCVDIVKVLGLSFGAIDLILDNNEIYWFLEFNPTGQWAWLEQELELPMRKALYTVLEGD